MFVVEAFLNSESMITSQRLFNLNANVPRYGASKNTTKRWVLRFINIEMYTNWKAQTYSRLWKI